MDKVYIITAGSYSDYRIETVFSTREKAEAYCSAVKYSYEYPEIEEWPLDSFVDKLDKGYKCYKVVMRENGNAVKIEQSSPPYNIRDRFYTNWRSVAKKYDSVSGAQKNMDKDYIVEIHSYCWAKDEEHAVKIVNERRTRYIANDMYPLPSKVHDREYMDKIYEAMGQSDE